MDKNQASDSVAKEASYIKKDLHNLVFVAVGVVAILVLAYFLDTKLKFIDEFSSFLVGRFI